MHTYNIRLVRSTNAQPQSFACQVTVSPPCCRSLMNASLGYDAVQESEYEPRDSPTRQTLLLSPLGPDLQPLGPRRLELYINNR